MRVTQNLLSSQALAAIHAGLDRIARSQRQLATGRRFESPVEDPAGHAAATRLSARIALTEQHVRQATAARDALGTTDSVLGGVLDVMGRVHELAIAGADGARGAAERTAMAAEVNQLLEEVVDLANSTDGSRYIFGGRETLTAPLTVTRNPAGDITAATWNPRGVDGAVSVDVGEGFSVQTNIGGTAVLGADTSPTFLPALLVSLRDALTANNPAAVNALLGDLQTADTRVNDARAVVGSRLRTVERALTDLESTAIATQAAQSAVLDADIGKVAVELSRNEAVYQAALHAAAKAIQPSLLEFLR